MYRQLFRHFTALTIRSNSNAFQSVQRAMHQQQQNHPFPCISKPAPDFKGQAVIDGHFKEIQLSDYKGKYVVLFFYPLDFTFVCPTELIAFNEKLDQFRQLDTQVIGCSTDSVYSHLGTFFECKRQTSIIRSHVRLLFMSHLMNRTLFLAWINTPRKQGGLGNLKYPLLSDFSKEITRRYGILVDSNGGIALRGLFIIDREQNLRQITINDLPVGRSVDEILRLIKAFQFVEKHGEVCPANWNEQTNPNTIKPDPVQSQEYFQKQT
jgi:alkyl hydroperoxide reductase subunit AhpC